ncbi:MAG: PKD domain-containing protein [Planctomycetota bacterium]
MKRMRVLVIVMAVLFSASAESAKIIKVDDDGPADYSRIQNAIDAAGQGDEIIVEPGRYCENINFKGKAITVRSSEPDDPCIVETTIIDANGVGSVVTFADSEDRDSVLQGFTLTGGTGTEWMADYYAGGGIYCIVAAPSILQNIITGNSVNESGGGLFCDVGSHALLYKNTITGNSAKKGGAVFTQAAQIEAQNNVICHNTARHKGGGLHLYGKTVLVNNMVYGNETTYLEGGGIYLSIADNSIITENTVVANYSKLYGANLHIRLSENVTVTNNIIVNGLRGAGIYLSDSSIFPKYNNVWNNEGGNYNGMSDPTGVEGNISDDPLFDPNSIDYHLQVASPCIDAGDPAYIAEPGETDIDGEPRVMGGRIDIGADEFSVNLKPVADAGLDQTYSSIPSQVVLDGSGSYDINGDSLTHRWRQIDGLSVELSDPSVVDPCFVPAELGIYVFELVVNDGLVDSDPDIVGIVVGNNRAPVADAGLARYAAYASVILDGTGSYDPDGYGIVSYQWTQTSGPVVVITGPNTTTPAISGFTQTGMIQECEFELVVSDSELMSLPDTVKVIIVPAFGKNALAQTNPPFHPNKPTILGFGGGYDCGHGVNYDFSYKTSFWYEKANILTTTDDWYSSRYQNYGDMLIVFLSSRAPDYKQPTQTIGYSAGNGPAIDVASYINLTYGDARYAVNRVTLLDAACGDYPARVNAFLGSSVDAEPCLVDNYMATHGPFCPGALNVRFPTVPPDRPWDEWWGVYHAVPRRWYEKSSDPAEWVNGDIFNAGITAGAYVSVAGPARNLQLAPGSSKYYFRWSGEDPNDVSDAVPDTLLFYNESFYPGRLPEPVTLVGPEDGAVVDANATLLSCEDSENAVGFQLLFGADSQNVNYIIVDTNGPPGEMITAWPFARTWWTIKARDRYGTTIFADPRRLKANSFTYLAYIADNWLETGFNMQGDLNNDQILDFKDFAIFANEWLREE